MEEQTILIVISLLFVLIGLVLISTLLANSDPYEYISTSNAEKLRTAMEQACDGQNQKISFSLPQNVPVLTSIFSFGTSWLLYEGGDPHYTLYYEMFPAGDAIGWESYQKYGSKALTYIGEGGQPITNTDEVKEYMKDVKEKLNERDVNADIVILRNVILSADFPHYQNYRLDRRQNTGSSSDDFISSFFGFGEWKRVDNAGNPREGDNFFEFTNYDALPTEEKTAIKYMPCGDHSLCLKTRDGVYRYKMMNCEAQDIKYVALAYDDRSIGEGYVSTVGAGAVVAGVAAAGIIYGVPAAVTTTAAASFRIASFISKIPYVKTIGLVASTYAADKLAHYFFTIFLSYRVSDFGITSPCAAEDVEITKTRCGDIPDEYSCSRMEKIPIMKFDDSTVGLSKVSDHYTCVEKFNENYDAAASNPDVFTLESGEISDDQCLLVKVTKLPEGYCWTPDPYKELSLNFFTQGPTQLFARNLGLNPVREYTSYLYNNMPGPVTLLLPWNNEKFFIDRNGGTISWGWPQHNGEGIVGDLVELPGAVVSGITS